MNYAMRSRIINIFEKIALLGHTHGVETWKVIESFREDKYYLLRNLIIEVEDDLVISSDCDNILLYNNYVFKMFLLESITSIRMVDNLTFCIHLKDGIITINGLVE